MYHPFTDPGPERKSEAPETVPMPQRGNRPALRRRFVQQTMRETNGATLSVSYLPLPLPTALAALLLLLVLLLPLLRSLDVFGLPFLEIGSALGLFGPGALLTCPFLRGFAFFHDLLLSEGRANRTRS
jgi:hypothetical protein